MTFKYLTFILLMGLIMPSQAQSNLTLDHHIDLGHSQMSRNINRVGHIHVLGGGAGALMASSMDISKDMKKDFYLISSIATTFGGAHYLSSATTKRRLFSNSLAKDEQRLKGKEKSLKDLEIQKEIYYRNLADQARHSRIYSSASLIATGAGYLAYFAKYRNDPSRDAHRASLGALILGAGKIIAGFGHLMNKSSVEKIGNKIFDKEEKKISWDIQYFRDAPSLNLAMSF